MSKKVKEEYVPADIVIRVRIEPAFKIVIESDSTGKKWSGHTWYGNTGLDVLRRVRNSLKLNEYKLDNLSFKTSTPQFVKATGWKEATFD